MLSLDHIVISGKNLNTASETYEDILTIKGGEHENWGTHNYLAYFNNHCYIEWLGINDHVLARNSDNPLIQHLVYLLDLDIETPFQFAFRTTKMDAFVRHFQLENIPFLGSVDGKRQKPDGQVLTWRMLFPLYDFTKETLPFLIEWNQPEEVRVDTTVINEHAISAVHFNGSIERIETIYQLTSNGKGKIILDNTEIIFTEKVRKLHFQID